MSLSRVYVLPYRQHSGQTEVLVGFKQVVSFEAVARQLHNNFDTWRHINFANPLKDDGSVNLRGTGGRFGKRFNGVLLPAGGKPAFFGGGVERNESPKKAVIREFLDEVGLDGIKIGEEAVGNPFYTTDWGGAYFALDVTKHMMNFNWENHLAKTNSRIKNFEDNADCLANVANAGFDPHQWYPEMHRLSWVPTNALVDTMKAFDCANVHHEIQKFAIFLLNRLQVSQDLNLFAKAVENHMLKSPIDSNVEAAQRLLDMFKL